MHDRELVGREQQFVLAGAGGIHVDSREHPALGDLAIQFQFGVAGALELLEDHRVAGGTGLDHGGGDDGQGATVLDIAGSPEEPLRRVERCRVDTAGQDASRRRRSVVVGAAQAGDRVEQHHHILALLHQSLRTLDGQLGSLGVIGRRAVEGGGDDLTLDRALHIGDFLRSLIDEHDHQMAFRVIAGNRVGDVLHDRGLAGLGWRDDQGTLALADRHDEVDDAGGQLLRSGLQAQPLIGVERGQLAELGTIAGILDRTAIDAVKAHQWIELLALVVRVALFGYSHRTGDGVATAQSVLADHIHRDVYVVGAGQIAGGTHEGVVVENVEDAGDRLDDVVLTQFGLTAADSVAAAGTFAAAPPIAEASPTATAAAVSVIVTVVLTTRLATVVGGLPGVAAIVGSALGTVGFPLTTALSPGLTGAAVRTTVLAAVGRALLVGPRRFRVRGRGRGAAFISAAPLGTTAAAGFPDRGDQIALAHPGGALHADAVGQRTQFRQHHRGQRATRVGGRGCGWAVGFHGGRRLGLPSKGLRRAVLRRDEVRISHGFPFLPRVFIMRGFLARR